MTDVLERFLRYVQVDTQSADEHCDQVPSTDIQFDLARLLADELRENGCSRCDGDRARLCHGADPAVARI